jgi:hypothetical protein
MEPEKSIVDEIVEEAKEMYSKMSLLELLAEENMVTEFLHKKRMDNARRRLREILRVEIEKRLR